MIHLDRTASKEAIKFMAHIAAKRLPRRGVVQTPGTVPTVMLAVTVRDGDPFDAAIDALVAAVQARPFEHYLLGMPLPFPITWHDVSHDDETRGGVAVRCFREYVPDLFYHRIVLQVHGR